jgi:hypothetical protein
MQQHPDNEHIIIHAPRPGHPLMVARYSSVGCYPIFYYTEDGGVLCSYCVEDNIDYCCKVHDPGWHVIGHDANWENPEMYCDNCEARIESAYAEDDA